MLDEIGRNLPSLLEDSGFRHYVRGLRIPEWPEGRLRAETLPELRLYYVRLGFLASAYVNQVSEPRADTLPHNVAGPLCNACALLGRPPILSYDGYALYNWRRFDASGPIALGNLDTLQNFVHLYDERWFILVHVEIEAIGAQALAGMDRAARAAASRDGAEVSLALREIASAVWRQVAVLRRIPEKMDPALYYQTFRPYIRFFENVVYEGVAQTAMNFRGEIGAQSSLMPALIAFMKIPHRQSVLTDHLADMRRFMPPDHRQLIAELEALPPMRDLADPQAYNDILEAMATFREVHYTWAQRFTSTAGSRSARNGRNAVMEWLRRLMTNAHAQAALSPKP